MVELTLPIIIGAAAVDSINPCAFGVLIFLLAYLSTAFKKQRAKILCHGAMYTLAVFLTYFVAGIILLYLLGILNTLKTFSVIMYYVLAALIGIAGIIEIKDYFWYGKGFSLGIFPAAAKRIKVYVKKVSAKLSTAFYLGVFVALVELPCTGAVYLAILAMLGIKGITVTNIWLLVLYNFIFVLPLFVIIVLFYKGYTAHQFEAWRLKNRKLMRLVTGLVLLGLAAWMIWYTLTL